MRITYSSAIIFIMLYSILGWLIETIACSVEARKFVYRGFLNGPWCPIYGFGVIFILIATYGREEWPPIVFAVSLVLTSAFEYFVSWLMEYLFQARWWDYSHKRFNIKGRVCLTNSLFFGTMGLIIVYFLHPAVASAVGRIPANYQRLLASLLILIITIDLIKTISSMAGIMEKVRETGEVLSDLKRVLQENEWYDKTDLKSSVDRLRGLGEENKALNDIFTRLDKGISRGGKRIIKGYPNIKIQNMDEALQLIRENLNKGREKYGKGFVKLKLKSIAESWKMISNAKISGFGFYQTVFVFALASFAGYIIEFTISIITNGAVESRQGLLFGPVNQIYGFGAVILVMVYRKLASKNTAFLYAVCVLISGVVEYTFSLLQELLFGMVSWSYEGTLFSVGGRTNLLSALFWGLIGLLFLKLAYPRLMSLTGRSPKRLRLLLSWMILILFTLNIAVSSMAVARWAERRGGREASNWVEMKLDQRFPDEEMEDIYPNMRLVE